MRLFKYIHADRANVLREGVIRFSSPRVLNDPFELKPHVSALAPPGRIQSELTRKLPDLLAGEYAKLPAQFRASVSLDAFLSFAKAHIPNALEHVEHLAESVLSMVRREMPKKFEEMIGILCLTESPDNLLMWAHYAESHQGFVIEFDPDSAFFDQRRGPDDEFGYLRKVLYSERRPSFVLSEVEDFSPFLTKGEEWRYEAEWRMMLPLSSANKIIGDGPTATHLFEYPKSAIRSVIFGCRMIESKQAEILQIVRETAEYEHVQCINAKIDETRYRLLIAGVTG